MKKIVILAFFSMVLFSNVAFADSMFRCGSRLIKVGETLYEVLRKCGVPDYRDIMLKNTVTRVYAKKTESEVFSLGDEVWYYDCGKKQFLIILTFNSSNLRSIKKGGYGSKRGLPCPLTGVWTKRKTLAR